ncbi:SRPBCC family protein [Bacillus sp. DX1.1]|uniref:SRPBCC family protein n=1 Tax=unclassified Bacillus (in: firmicutes) TaxID=185979 RepID=UPI002570162F|nr:MULTISPECIES: SRPBCC family protein [unclassified Bacillus (in: firmicutes)]MDM5155680.1 SRPBCC family protein [Bacillus sp. DX1.1]WJE79983.1 SRPBCC family protein [Bacillus sp. DX3.1]
MKIWTEEIQIDTPIEHLFSFLDGSLEQMQKLMPHVIENTPIKETEAVVGNVYRQKYKEGEEIQEYDVETLEYVNTPTHKTLKIGFVLANMFDVTATYELKQTNENQTLFKYTATNKALTEQAEFFMKSATNQIAVDFVNRFKKIAESEYNK